MKNLHLILFILAAVLFAIAVLINPPERYDRLRFIAAALLALTLTLILPGCTYDDAAAFGQAADNAAASYYRNRQPAYAAPAQPAAPMAYPAYQAQPGYSYPRP